MICYVCDQDNWHSFGNLNPERELLCCLNCGSVCYKVDAEQEKKMLDYYRKEYRPQPNHMNLLTTTRKQNYVNIFLSDYMRGKKDMVICDVGCATGYLVNHFRTLGHKATGCEYTITYRRFAENFYGIPITEEIRKDLKYDLITIYHVLEHMVEPDKKLEQYVSLLNDDGRMLISTPQWYEDLQEASGPTVTTFTNLWHKDHINVFSEQTMKNLFAKVGLEVEKEDHYVYGQTYLVKKAPRGTIKIEDPKEKIDKTLAAYSAIDLFNKKKFREAIKLWPRFPDAWLGIIFTEAGKDPFKQADIYAESEKIMPHNHRIESAKCIWFYQNEKYKEAIELMESIVKIKPDEDKYMYIGYSYSNMGLQKEAMRWFYRAAEMNPQKWTEAFDWLCKCSSTLPTWDERALKSITEEVSETAKKSLKLVDPMFDKQKEPTMDIIKDVISNGHKSEEKPYTDQQLVEKQEGEPIQLG